MRFQAAVKASSLVLLALGLVPQLWADDEARFNLEGPKISVRVTRGTITLPIAEVPNLVAGDKLWVKANLPETQRNHLVLVVAFLRGTTNEPPDNWFTEIDTWDKKFREGSTVVVPQGAEQALMFIAPETGGDFKTLRGAVRGRPGLFIRADADLNEASFEQQRIEHYLAAMKEAPQGDAKSIQEHSTKLAATLELKPDDKCFKEPVESQVTCLTQSSAPLLLNDGHGMGVAEALSSGPSSDFINQASYTQPVGAGLYSAYVGAVVDLVHLVSLLKTAQFQYIPGLAFPQNEVLNLKLNAPPSFINPKTVIVIGLPAIQKAKLPPLHPHDANEVACLLNPKMVLPVEGAPLVFSTSFAHDLVLHLNRTGTPDDMPLRADAYEGGLVIAKEPARKQLDPLKQDEAPKGTPKIGSASDLAITGTIEGYWGFDHFTGPTITLQQKDGGGWKIAGDTQPLAGAESHLKLTADGTGCVEHIALATEKAKDVDVSFTPAKGGDGKEAKNTLDIAVSLKGASPGGYALGIRQYGDANEEKVPLTAYDAAIHLDSLKIHAGDKTAILAGKGLGDIVSVEVSGQTFTPEGAAGNDGTLTLAAKEAASPKDGSDAKAKLKDGRQLTVKVSVEAARPTLALLSMTSAQRDEQGIVPVKVDSKEAIPLDGTLHFVVQTKAVFPRTQMVEVATADGSVTTKLSLAQGNLVLQDDHTAVATLDPSKAFGASAFGPLAMRPVSSDGTAGDWTRLGVLVRSPQITGVDCAVGSASCTVHGHNLFFAAAFSADKDFAHPTQVPTGFADESLQVPVPTDGSTLYVHLRDDPSAEAELTLPNPVKPAVAATTQSSAAAPPVPNPRP
ncbi:hypothetical protein SAMN05421819_1028 [Bryocella elongata]|uniref:Uncharacterized protein n=1 Tax=Bryocella elongata TaxID=863522 RepID=A0A1H5UH89_9BACT|nr:hypothetical protein SAMN05421819_1028 [Bryocella elongata]